jgi:hypothetical protein
MKTAIIVLLATVLFSGTAQAQDSNFFESNKPLICGKFSAIVDLLMGDKFREVPVWLGTDARDGTRYSLFINDKTKTWTFVQYRENTACVLGVGGSSQNLILPAPI